MRRVIYKLFLIFVLPALALAQTSLVNINIAPTTELETLNGIGPAYAQRIVDYRTQNGPFQKIEDIKNVKGIGDVTYNKIKDYITAGEPASSPPSSGQESPPVNPQANNVSNAEAYSAHYSSAPLSALSATTTLSVTAGRDRLGSVSSPLEFRAETNLSHLRNMIFKWNFGDGSIGYGEAVRHTYTYPGDYVVVLNLSGLEGKAVSRLNVKIVEPRISTTYIGPDRVELKNDSSYEINLFGRTINAYGKTFVFEEDTIIKPGQNISFSSEVTGLRPSQMEALPAPQIASTIITSPTITSFVRTPVVPSSTSATTSNIANAIEAVSGVKTEERKGWLQTLKRFFLRTK